MQNSSSMSGDSELVKSALSASEVTHSVIDTQDLPDGLKDLYPFAEIDSSHDAFVILLHAFMMEVGFIPKDIHESEKLKLLPKDWRKKGLYSIVYFHPTCPEVFCSMTCVPLYQQLSIFGTVTDVHMSQEPPNICLQVSCYVNNDNIGSSALGVGPTFGLVAAMADVKMQILSYLPVGGFVSMSCVNKEFKELCNSSSLWKKLYMRDFHNGVHDRDEANQEWKKLYKEKYLKQKQHSRFLLLPRRKNFCRTTEELHPPLCIPYPFGPDFPFGIQDTRVPFPHLQPEARPHNVIRPPPFPHNPLLNIPYIFQL